eukprot:Gb_17667 [translate_table: standard]
MGKMQWFCVIAIIAMMIINTSTISMACVPPSVVECEHDQDCTIFNHKGIWEDRNICKAEKAVFPSTEEEIIAAVADAVKNKRKVKVTSRYAHSLGNLACVEESGVIINTVHYKSHMHVNTSEQTITVDSGAIMREVIDEAAREGLAFPPMVYWEGVSAGGAISTGAHGSGLIGKGSALHEHVVGIRLVIPASPSQGYAKVITLNESDEELNAARLSLGTLGVISQVTFALEPMFKRSVSYSLRDDIDLENQLEGFLRSHEFGDLFWFPSFGKARFGSIGRVSVDVPGNGVNKAIGQPAKVLEVEKDAAMYDMIDTREGSERMCNFTRQGLASSTVDGIGFLNDEKYGNFSGYPVIGFNHLMQTSGGCQGRYPNEDHLSCKANRILDKNESICPWDRRVRGSLDFDVEIRVPLSRARDAILDIKKIRDVNPRALCELAIQGGIIMRSVKKSEAYLGNSEDVVTFELQYLRHREAKTPKWNMDVYEEIEQLLMQKYGGTLHWGKSGGVLFRGIAKRTVNLNKFLSVKQKFDRDGVFSNAWTDEMLTIGNAFFDPKRPSCTLEKMCICSHDKDCVPEKGYLCLPGRIWKKARVCRKIE